MQINSPQVAYFTTTLYSDKFIITEKKNAGHFQKALPSHACSDVLLG